MLLYKSNRISINFQITNQLIDTPALTKLIIDLSAVSPEDAFSAVPYAKGQNFLRYLEQLLGGPASFEEFLRFYFNKFKYQSIRSDDFRVTLYEYFREKYESELVKINWDLWFYSEGMPPVIPKYNTTLSDVAHKHADVWIHNSVDNIKKTIGNDTLTVLLKIEFLFTLNEAKDISGLSTEWISLLEEKYELHKTKNAKIRFAFLRLCIRARQFSRIDEIFSFLNSNYLLEYIRPLYRDLGHWREARNMTVANFNNINDQMMAVCSNEVAKDLGLA